MVPSHAETFRSDDFAVFAGPSLGSKTVVLRSGLVTLGAPGAEM